MGNYSFHYSDPEDEMDLDEKPKKSREQSSSTNQTSFPPDWWSFDPKGSDIASSSITGASYPDCWTSNSSTSNNSPAAESSNGSEAALSSATGASSASGNWVVVPTGATGLQCGLLAIISSLEHQTDFIRIPKLEELSDIAKTGYIGEFIQALGAIGTDEAWDRNFTEDHLDAILQEYGILQGAIKLRLGVQHADDGWRTVFDRKAIEDQDAFVVWVHHDGADAASDAEYQSSGHYSGLAPLE